MMALFQAKGEKSKPEIVFEQISDFPSDAVIPYERFVYERPEIFGVMTSVSKRLEREQSRHVVNVRGEGFKIVQGPAQVDSAQRHGRRAAKKLRRALQIAKTVDRSEMSAEERARADSTLIQLQIGANGMTGMFSKSLGIEQIREWDQQQRGRDAA